MKQQYDVVVIGAGSGGLTTAVGFSKAGKKVLLVEREHMGGECTNSGCIPSKALLHHAKTYHAAKHIAGETAKTETYRHNALTYVQQTVQHILDSETPETFAKLGIDVVLGEAAFHTKNSIKVGDTEYTYKTAVIATGSSPRLIEVPGLSETDILTNQNVFELKNIPEKILVIGSGPIGMELGQAFALLGSTVSIASIDTDFARLEDIAVRTILQTDFTELGIQVVLQAFISRVEGKTAIFTIKNGDVIVGEKKIDFDKILIAIGRVPNLPLGMDKAGVTFNTQSILVDSQSRTTNKHVYAIGDVAQSLKFTHVADDRARQVVMHVVSKRFLRSTVKKAVPKVTYTTPEIAQVGLSWDQAVTQYSAERIMRIEVPFLENDRAKTDDQSTGSLIVIARRLTGTVLGAHIISPAAGEIINIFTLSIDQKISLWKLRKLIFAYPTYSLIVRKAADQFVGRQLASLKSDVWMTTKRHLPKFLIIIFWAIILFSFQYYRITHDLTYRDVLLQQLRFFTDTIWGPAIYIAITAFRPPALFPATALTVFSGALFGFWWGILFTLIGENISANFGYWMGRFFGKDLRLENTAIIKYFIKDLRKRSFETVLLMRLFYLPFDLTNYSSGIVKAKWSAYFWATVIGILPGAITFVALGAAIDIERFKMDGFTIDTFNPKFLLLSVVIFMITYSFSRLLKLRKSKE